VAQGVGPEFKPQYHQKKKKKERNGSLALTVKNDLAIKSIGGKAELTGATT
jgi:hypothetical protein